MRELRAVGGGFSLAACGTAFRVRCASLFTKAHTGEGSRTRNRKKQTTRASSQPARSVLLLGGALALLYDRRLRDRGGGRVGLDGLTGLLESCNALRLSVSRMGLPPWKIFHYK